MIPLEKHPKFYSYPYTIDEADIILIGIPYREAHHRNTLLVRDASNWLEDNSISTPQYYSHLKICDAGDITSDTDIKEVLANLPKVKTPIFFGGPHVYTYHIVKALKPSTLIILDAHLDAKDEFQGEKLNSATFVRRIAEEGIVEKIVVIGARSYDEEEFQYVLDSQYIYPQMDYRLPKSEIEGDTIYLSIDIDFLDTSYITETPYPEAWGAGPNDLTNILRELSQSKYKVVGADVMEYLPRRGLHHEAKTVARIILETASVINYIRRK